MRKLIVIICLFSSTAFANSANTGNRAMGDTRLIDLDNPALSALGNTNFSFTLLSVDVRGSLSSAFGAYSWVNDVVDFKNSIEDISNILEKKDKLSSLLLNATRSVDVYNHIDLLKFFLGNNKIGKFHFGVYVDGKAGVRIKGMDTNNITIINNAVDIGKSIDIVSAMGREDGGVQVGFGRAEKLPYDMKISYGLVNRTFYSFKTVPIVFHLNQTITGENDISIPDFDYSKGLGFAFDVPVALDFNDFLFATRFVVGLNNFGGVWYDGVGERERANISVGALIHPLHYWGRDNLGAGSTIRFYEGETPSLHLGAYYYLGNRWLNFTPMIGGAIGDRGVYGEKKNVLTCGFSTMLGLVSLGGSFEYLGGSEYNVSVHLGLGN